MMIKATALIIDMDSKIYTTYRETIYHKDPRYGNIFNINDPVVHMFYEQYLLEHGIPKYIGLSDRQRKNFESEIQLRINKGIIRIKNRYNGGTNNVRSRNTKGRLSMRR
jgi:hypothetical protein